MKNQSIILAVVSVSLSASLVACSSGGGGDTPKVACTSKAVTANPQPSTCNGASFTVQDASNYSFSSVIKLEPVTVKSMTNLTIDWSAVTQDFLGHPLNTVNDLNMAALLMWALPLATLETRLNDDTLSQNDLNTPVPPSWPPDGNTMGKTSAQAYDFKVNGYVIPPADYNKYLDPVMYPESDNSYMAAVATGDELGQGFRMLQTFRLDPASSATTVALKNDSAKLTCQASLRNLTITGVPGSTAGLTLDYTQLTKTATGASFDPAVITRVVVGHYSQTLEELETKFLDLDLIATDYYQGGIADVGTIDLTTLKDKSNVSFPGVTNDGTWLVGLICTGCRNPAPLYMTVLKPCAS